MNYVGAPYIPSNAARKTRLIGFDASYSAGGYALKPEHTIALDKLADFVSRTSEFSCWIVGYASKAGNHHANKTYQRTEPFPSRLTSNLKMGFLAMTSVWPSS